MPPLLPPSIATAGHRLRTGATTVAAEIAAARARIDRLNPRFRAFSHLAPADPATADTLDAELRAGRPRGSLHGITASIKGNIPVAGLPWTEGSRLFAARKAENDAGIVARLRAAGGVVLGVTTLSELAMYGVTNSFEPMGLNPWDPARTAGGSSTGAGVAAALGLATVNIGTDSGGSIRNPACHCGVVGLMPRIGALTLAGKRNYTPSLSSIGLIARSVADVATAYRALAEVRTDAAAASGRLLVPRRLIERMCDDETRALFAAVLDGASRAGFDLLERDLDEWSAGEAAAGTISLYESGLALRKIDLSLASVGLRRRAEAASHLTEEHLRAARRAAASLKHAVAEALSEADADAFVSPTWPFAAPPIDADWLPVNGKTVPIDPHRNCFVRAANAIDAAALTLPMGLYPTAMVPAGLHLMATGGSEERLIDVAGRIEAAIPALPLPPPLRNIPAD